MKPIISTEDVENAKLLKESWKHPEIPFRQWKAIDVERAYLANCEYYKVPPFKTFIDACHWIADRELQEEMDILDAGASSGYYSQVLKSAGYTWSYTGMDYSPAFKDFAKRLYPYVYFDIGELTDLPYSDKMFKIVTLNITNLHVDDWRKALDEAFRVARKYVIVHRLPLQGSEVFPTMMYEDEAYGVKMIHTVFNESEFHNYIATKTEKQHAIFPIYDTNQITYVVEK